MTFSDHVLGQIRKQNELALALDAETTRRLIDTQQRRLISLDRRARKLLDAYLADALPIEQLKREQATIATGTAAAKRLISHAEIDASTVLERLDIVMGLLDVASEL